MKKIITGFIIVILLALIFAALWWSKKSDFSFEKNEAPSEQLELKDEQDSAETVEINKNLGSNIFLTGIDSYIGSYVEDGSDEFVENVMMITLENKGNEFVQFATIAINEKYVFEFTTLFPGEKMMILEKNRAEYTEDFEIVSAKISQVALFDNEPSLQEEILEINGEDGMIIVTNISGKYFAGGKVFYKNVLDDKYLGGITYSGRIPDLEIGQSVKMSANHYYIDSSEFLFVTCAGY